jgi:hypothetical protein
VIGGATTRFSSETKRINQSDSHAVCLHSSTTSISYSHGVCSSTTTSHSSAVLI